MNRFLIPFFFCLASNAFAQDAVIVDRFKQMTAETTWELVSQDTVAFDTYHPQGFALVDSLLYLTSVEVTEWPRRLDPPQPDRDRTDGKGRPWIFVIDKQGRLIKQQIIESHNLRSYREKAGIYHPGGIDYDGTYLWTAVAAYRPHSHSTVVRIDPVSLQGEDWFLQADHIGAVVYAADRKTMYLFNWGSRMIRRTIEISADDLNSTRYANASHYVDYQDCSYLGDGLALCGGVKSIGSGAQRIRLGGLDLVELETGRPLHQVPVPLWTEAGLPLTQNPFEVEATDTGLRFYFMPEDNVSRLFVYDVTFSAPEP